MANIGKNVIENLTTAMYEDLKIIYREYIQNAADAIDNAISFGLIKREEARIDIEISARDRYIRVLDNGTGIPADLFQHVMLSIADSSKDRSSDKGFRGIGRLGGISCCDKLVFSCSAAGENVKSVCVWDAKRVREILVDTHQNPSASELVDLVTSFSKAPCDLDTHFFSVTLLDIDQTSEELLDKKRVIDYLCAVAPIPYATGFIFKSKIAEFAKEHGFTIDEYQIFVCGERLFKPYTTKLYETYGSGQKRAYDELVDVAFAVFPDTGEKPLAWMWYGISKFEKQIPSINEMRGIRLRKNNIQIGNEHTFSAHGFYAEPRGCLYFVGEVFAVHEDLIPNARRDYFNLNDTNRTFERLLRPLFYERFKLIYNRANDYKKALQKQQQLQNSQADYEKKASTGGFINEQEKQEREAELESLTKAAEKAKTQIAARDQKDEDDQVLRRIYRALYDTYHVSPPPSDLVSAPTPVKSKRTDFISGDLSNISRKERKIVSRIYGILYAILPKNTAEMVIKKIQEELKK